MNSHRRTESCMQTDRPVLWREEKWAFRVQPAQWGGRCGENEAGDGGPVGGRPEGQKLGDNFLCGVQWLSQALNGMSGRPGNEVNKITHVRWSPMFKGAQSRAVLCSHSVPRRTPKNPAVTDRGSEWVGLGVPRSEGDCPARIRFKGPPVPP